MNFGASVRRLPALVLCTAGLLFGAAGCRSGDQIELQPVGDAGLPPANTDGGTTPDGGTPPPVDGGTTPDGGTTRRRHSHRRW